MRRNDPVLEHSLRSVTTGLENTLIRRKTQLHRGAPSCAPCLAPVNPGVYTCGKAPLHALLNLLRLRILELKGAVNLPQLLQANVRSEEHRCHTPRDCPAPSVVVLVVLFAIEADLLVAQCRGNSVVRRVVAGKEAEEREPDGHEGEHGGLCKVPVDAKAKEPSEHHAEHHAATLAHHLDALVHVAQLGPIAEVGEKAEQQGGVVTWRRLLKCLAAQDQPNEDQDRAAGTFGQGLVQRSEHPAEEKDEVEDAVEEAVATPCAEGLVDGVPDVHCGGVEGSEECAKAGAQTIHNHCLCHGVVVACCRGALHAAHGPHEAHHTHQEQCGDEAANLREPTKAYKDRT
mmetsp:Transcript_73456/g.175179  ORF Transcript_73456/g.175179 Transcript_73456/m.175179 type:complete len:344 (+) Transcript_73456:145-1176(+)